MAVNVLIVGQRSEPARELFRLLWSPHVNVESVSQDIVDTPAVLFEKSKTADVVVIAGHGFISRSVMSSIDPNRIVIDLSPEYRTDPGWTYCNFAVTKNFDDAIRIAGPGCFATSAISILRPLSVAGALANTPFIYVNSLNGYSAGGFKMVEEVEKTRSEVTRFSVAAEHRHVPEIRQYAEISQPLTMSATIGTHKRGLLTSIPIIHSSQSVREILVEFHKGSNILISSRTPSKISAIELANQTGAAIYIADRDYGCEVFCVMDNILLGSVEYVSKFILSLVKKFA